VRPENGEKLVLNIIAEVILACYVIAFWMILTKRNSKDNNIFNFLCLTGLILTITLCILEIVS